MCVALEIERTFDCKISFWQKSETEQDVSRICTSQRSTCYPIEKYNCSETFTQRDLNLLKTTFMRDWVLPRTYEFI